MTVTFDTIRLFELLKPKLGAEESKAIVDALDAIPDSIKQEVEIRLETSTKNLATKEDILRLEVKLQEKFNSLLIWPIATIFAATGITLTVIKLF